MIPQQRKTVAVIGSGNEEHREHCEPLGRWLADQGFDLINGGGGGVMRACAEAFCQVPGRTGQVIGILPSAASCTSPEERRNYRSLSGYPNPYIDRVICTHLPLSGALGKDLASRNHIIVLTADWVIALPGGEGTRSEIQLALEYGKPIVAICPQGEWKEYENSKLLRVNSTGDAIAWLNRVSQRESRSLS